MANSGPGGAGPNKGGNNQGGNNKGGNNKGGNQPRRNSNKLEQSARRNVNVSFQPGINAAYRGLDQANLDYQNKDLGYQSIYNAMPQEFDKLNTQYENRTGGIADDLTNQLTKFSSGLNQEGLPQAEVAANTAVYGTQGNNFLNHLASNDQRALQWNQSGERESNLSERYGRQNLQQELSDTQQQYYNRIADLQEQKQPAILSELDRLRQQQQSNKQEKLLSGLYQDLIGNSLGGGNGGGGGNGSGNGGNGGGAGPGGGTISHANIDNQNGLTSDELQNQPNRNQRRAHQISSGINYAGPGDEANSVQTFSGLPQWLQDLYMNNQGPERWNAVENSPVRRRVFRQTRPWVRNLYDIYQQAPGAQG